MADQPKQDKAIFPIEGFIEDYANNVQMEQSPYDLKLIFGEQHQREGKFVVEQKIGIRLSWTQAKLMAYFLNVNIATYELENGTIRVPNNVRPVMATVPEEQKDNALWKQGVDVINKIREQFIASLPA